LSGAGAGGIAHAAHPVLLFYPRQDDLPDAPLRIRSSVRKGSKAGIELA
jgi:hypothetical protein